jgi:hypothetical protein
MIHTDYEFKCPKCTSPEFEAVMENVVRMCQFDTATLEEVNSNCHELIPNFFGDDEYLGGELACYRCRICGHIVAMNDTQMMDWLKEHGKKIESSQKD